MTRGAVEVWHRHLRTTPTPYPNTVPAHPAHFQAEAQDRPACEEGFGGAERRSVGRCLVPVPVTAPAGCSPGSADRYGRRLRGEVATVAQLVACEIDFADTAPVVAEGAAVVVGTPAEVWAVLVDHERWPAWFAGVKACRTTSEPATGIGSTRQVVLEGGARFEERFIAWDEGERWAFTATEMRPAAFRSLVERVTIAELAPRRTRVTYRMAFDPKPWLKPAAPVLAKAISANLAKAMRSLSGEVVKRRDP